MVATQRRAIRSGKKSSGSVGDAGDDELEHLLLRGLRDRVLDAGAGRRRRGLDRRWRAGGSLPEVVAGARCRKHDDPDREQLATFHGDLAVPPAGASSATHAAVGFVRRYTLAPGATSRPASAATD